MHDPRDNPMYGLLQARQRSVWELDLVAAMVGAALLGLKTGPHVVSALFVVLFALVRSYRDSSRLTSLVQGRGIEEALMARTSFYTLLDGMTLFCLRASALPGVVFWLWLVLLELITKDVTAAQLTLLLWLPCLAITTASSCYLMQLSASGMMGRRLVPTVLILLWLGLLVALAALLALSHYGPLPLVVGGLAAVAALARRYTGAALLDRLTPPPSLVRTRAPYRPWWPQEDPILLREAACEHHRGKAWLSWLAVAAFSVLAASFTLDAMWMLYLCFVPYVTLWAAYRTSPAVIQEREARTFEVIALTQLRSEKFVDGWAAHGWRPLAWQILIPTAALYLKMASNPYSGQAAFTAVLYGTFLVAAAQAGAYIGVWASTRAGSRNYLSGLILGGGLGAGAMFLFGVVGLAFTNRQAVLVWPWLAGLAVAFLFRWETLLKLSVSGARPPQGWPLLLLLLLTAPPYWVTILTVILFLAAVHRQVRLLPGLAVTSALLLVLAWGVDNGPARGHKQGQLTACKSNLRNIGTALEMYSTDYSGRYPTSSTLLTPNYLKTIPTCPAVGECTYVFQTASNPDLFTVVCSGDNHRIPALNYPQFTSVKGGVRERP